LRKSLPRLEPDEAARLQEIWQVRMQHGRPGARQDHLAG
jgi:hypothetical protein